MTSLEKSRVLVVGVGGLGCPAALALARAGVGTIGLVDEDLVELGNLHRQILFTPEDVGQPKVDVAARALRAAAPSLVVEAHPTHLLPTNAIDLVSRYDVVLEGSDNFPTKFLAADAAHIAERPIVQGAAIRWHGTALAVSPSGRPCYRCVFEDVPQAHVPNCAEAGVMGPVVGVVGAIMADLALSLLAGEDVAGELVTFDGKDGRARRRRLSARPTCPLCGANAIDRLVASRYEAPVCEA